MRSVYHVSVFLYSFYCLLGAILTFPMASLCAVMQYYSLAVFNNYFVSSANRMP